MGYLETKMKSHGLAIERQSLSRAAAIANTGTLEIETRL